LPLSELHAIGGLGQMFNIGEVGHAPFAASYHGAAKSGQAQQ
jgi:hypothetical protein